MGIRALSSTSVNRSVNGLWDILVDVRDTDGYLVDSVPTVTVTLPAGSTVTPTVETISTGVYLAQLVVVTAGRYVARVVTTDDGAVDFAAYVTATTAGTGMPTVQDYRDYDEDNGGSWLDPEIQGALDAEAAAQRSVCRVGAVYPDDLRQALLRRVQRNLKMRGLPLAVLQGDAELGTSANLPGRDPEVRRLEAPHRKLVIG